jgi:hypothetical protein
MLNVCRPPGMCYLGLEGEHTTHDTTHDTHTHTPRSWAPSCLGLDGAIGRFVGAHDIETSLARQGRISPAAREVGGR